MTTATTILTARRASKTLPWYYVPGETFVRTHHHRLMHGRMWNPKLDPTGWVVSEKFDGFRCLWTGEKFESRTGNMFRVPDWFLDGMPAGVMIDGELWSGRGSLKHTQRVIRSKSGDWSQTWFVAFDVLNNEPVEDRVARLNSLSLPAHCRIAEHAICNSARHLEDLFYAVLGAGGEGLVLRAPGSLYQPGRVDHVRKLKPCKPS